MDRRCFITSAFIERMQQERPLSSFMYERLIQELQVIQERVGVAGNSPSVQRLRAFLCVEIMYSKLGVRLLSEAGCGHEAKELMEFKPGRAWADLGKVMESAEEYIGDITGAEIELGVEIRQRQGSGQWGHMARANGKPARQVFEYCYLSAEILRPQLKTYTGLAKVGDFLGWACVAANELPHRWVAYASELVKVTERIASRGWELQT